MVLKHALLPTLLLLLAFVATAQTPSQKRVGKQKPSTKPAPSSQANLETASPLEELEQTTQEINAYLRRLPSQEEELQVAIANIKGEFRLRELRWRTFDRIAAVEEAPFVYHPIRIELLGTYERITDAFLNLAASNYLIVVDGLEMKRAKQQAPLVSVEATFTLLLYTLPERDQFLIDLEAIRHKKIVPEELSSKLKQARNSLSLLDARFAERVGCWSAVRTLGKTFPKSLETVLLKVDYLEGQLSVSGISRLINSGDQISSSLMQAQIFKEVKVDQQGAAFNVETNLDFEKAYQKWLDGVDTTDTTSIARDPFSSPYTIDQLTRASTNYIPLEKRIEEYIKQVNSSNSKRPDRTSPYLISELSLSGVFYGPDLQGAIFKTPDQKEIYVGVGARCYNGRFTAVQQGRAIFEEMISGASQTSQIVKNIESECPVAAVLSILSSSEAAKELEVLAKDSLPDSAATLNVKNVELHTLLSVMHEISNKKFNFVLDSSVPKLCASVTRERATFSEVLLLALKKVNLLVAEEEGIYRIVPQTEAMDARAVAYATSLTYPPAEAQFGGSAYKPGLISLSITDAKFGDILKFITSKYSVNFNTIEEIENIRVTATVSEAEWTKVLAAILRANRLGALIESEKTTILTRQELVKLQSEGKAK
ncbi:MAG: type 4a pilus biogenesis protein PilO [Blastocatellia bacterium]|nr:type 4a pilus biogenesis protein PilO [Blastocatellia bacterium]